MEIIIRLAASLGIFFIMICWEFLSPRRSQRINRNQRWPINIMLGIFNMVIMRLTVGSFAYLSAVTSADNTWGLLNWLEAPEWLSIVVTLLFLDFAIYGQHIISHKWSPLWRLHQVHHTDLEFDATTAVRFHPLEIMTSMIYKVLCIFFIGANPYGFSLSCWDKLFKTYTAEPKLSQTTLSIGLEPYRQQSDLGFMPLLLLPFKKIR